MPTTPMPAPRSRITPTSLRRSGRARRARVATGSHAQRGSRSPDTHTPRRSTCGGWSLPMPHRTRSTSPSPDAARGPRCCGSPRPPRRARRSRVRSGWLTTWSAGTWWLRSRHPQRSRGVDLARARVDGQGVHRDPDRGGGTPRRSRTRHGAGDAAGGALLRLGRRRRGRPRSGVSRSGPTVRRHRCPRRVLLMRVLALYGPGLAEERLLLLDELRAYDLRGSWRSSSCSSAGTPSTSAVAPGRPMT